MKNGGETDECLEVAAVKEGNKTHTLVDEIDCCISQMDSF